MPKGQSTTEPNEAAAEAAAAEAGAEIAEIEVIDDDPTLGKGEKLVVLPLGDGESVTILVKRRWKRFKFVRAIARMDVLVALEILGATEEQVEQVEEADVDDAEFEKTIGSLAEALVGSAGKKKASASSGSPGR